MIEEGAPAADSRILFQIRRQRRQTTVPVHQPMLLCSQVQRSGGTLLTRLFDGHPGCFVHPSELRWGRPGAWPLTCHGQPTAEQAFSQLSEPWSHKFAMHGYSKHVADVRARLDVPSLPFLFDETLQFEIFANAFARGANRRRRDVLDAYLTSLFNAWLDYQNLYTGPKRAVVAFEPRFLARSDGGVEVFLADYPDGLLVTIVREPAAWLASYRTHVPSHDAQKALRLWSDSLEAGLAARAAHPERVVMVLFDDLVHRTEAVMRRLCGRLDLPFESSLLVPTYNSMPVPSDSSHAPVFGIDRTVTERRPAPPDDPEARESLSRASHRYAAVRDEVAAR